MDALAWIEKKRDGGRLSETDWRAFVEGVVQGAVPDYQVSALLMAIYFRGLEDEETAALTLAMRDSGQRFRWPADGRPVVDKHSTGGVGDKISLPLVPLLAALGFRVPMISGRSLGITGGTLDKLESIPGFVTRFSPERFLAQVQELGCAIVGQTEDLVPADRKLYALRDATGTVPSLPLITSSILSKKLAEGLDALVLDVKCGRAAFMADLDSARRLADTMVRLATLCGVQTVALVTAMDRPLGRAVGNWLEVRESHQFLQSAGGEGTHGDSAETFDHLRFLVIECAARLLCLTGRSAEETTARQQARECLRSGEPLRLWLRMLERQGADLAVYERMLEQDTLAPCVEEVTAPRDGWVIDCNARTVGALVRDLGGGRRVVDQAVDPRVGVDELVPVGTRVRRGDRLARVHGPDPPRTDEAARKLQQAFVLGDEPPPQPSLLLEVCVKPAKPG